MKRKILKTLCLIVAALGSLELLGNLAVWVIAKYHTISATRGEMASVGIIGGADGPTAVFVTTSVGGHWLIPLAMVALGLVGYLCLKKCNK